ncbi:hypothetical protein [Halostella litorea]|uniref:hypothetical protein n=1 Tax=Halostella litorea TaxID=2528831 RepID=UPI0010930DDC|nr:hypothetical protein [Halostella litorea]
MSGSDASGDPLDGEVLLMAGAKASVAPERLPALVDRVQADLGPRIDEYRRRYECVHEDDDRAAFLADADHWERVGEELDLHRRERDALARAHAEQVRRIGRKTDREAAMDSALEIRSAVVVGTSSEE